MVTLLQTVADFSAVKYVLESTISKNAHLVAILSVQTVAVPTLPLMRAVHVVELRQRFANTISYMDEHLSDAFPLQIPTP